MPADFNDVREYVGIRPMPTASHVGLRITARCSTPVYTCESPSRQEVVKQNYDRRRFQINSCGYRSVNFKPYKEVGEVILNEKELILKSLGQGDSYNAEGQDETENEQNNNGKVLGNDSQKEKEIFTIMQAKPENMQKLDDQLTKGRQLLSKVKLGIGLFKLIKEEQNRKAIEAELSRVRSEIEEKHSMRPYDPDLDFGSEIEDDELYSSFQAEGLVCPQAADDDSIVAKNEEMSRNDLQKEEYEERNDMKNETLNSDEVSLELKVSDAQMNPDGEVEPHRISDSGKEKKLLDRESQQFRVLYPYENNDVGRWLMRNDGAHVAKSKLSKSKKYKTALPRPFSPIFTNVNFYETGSKEYTFRQLCALHWILEAMSQDQTILMPPISTCWKLKDLKQDLQTAQLKVDRDKAVEPIWTAFLRNPNRFTRSKASGRSNLLQRRISIAPNALRRISAASSGTQTSAFKISTSSESLASSSAFHAQASKDEQRGRSWSKLGFSFKTDDDSLDGGKRFSSRKPTLAQVTEDATTQQVQIAAPSLKEKAFIVREVLLAKNVFGRRGSKMNQARSPSITTASKSTTDKLKKGTKKNAKTSRKESTSILSDKQETTSDLKFEAKNLDRLGVDTSAFSEFSTLAESEGIPMKLKERFEELAAEKALILHDNLEQREKTSVESMERKFYSLRVMSDVNKAISVMRSKSRLKVETDEEKKARFSEECSWYKSLLDNLPLCIREDRNNALVLDKIAKYGSMEGRKVSSIQFIKALTLLRPWELCHPDISAAIEFVRDKIVAMDKTEFETWFQSRLSESK